MRAAFGGKRGRVVLLVRQSIARASNIGISPTVSKQRARTTYRLFDYTVGFNGKSMVTGSIQGLYASQEGIAADRCRARKLSGNDVARDAGQRKVGNQLPFLVSAYITQDMESVSCKCGNQLPAA